VVNLLLPEMLQCADVTLPETETWSLESRHFKVKNQNRNLIRYTIMLQSYLHISINSCDSTIQRKTSSSSRSSSSSALAKKGTLVWLVPCPIRWADMAQTGRAVESVLSLLVLLTLQRLRMPRTSPGSPPRIVPRPECGHNCPKLVILDERVSQTTYARAGQRKEMLSLSP
jgi:hypothetical protein